MGVIQTSKDQALLVTNSSKEKAKGKSKKKDPKVADSNPKQNQKLSKGPAALKRRNLRRNYVHTMKKDTILKNIV